LRALGGGLSPSAPAAHLSDGRWTSRWLIYPMAGGPPGARPSPRLPAPNDDYIPRDAKQPPPTRGEGRFRTQGEDLSAAASPHLRSPRITLTQYYISFRGLSRHPFSLARQAPSEQLFPIPVSSAQKWRHYTGYEDLSVLAYQTAGITVSARPRPAANRTPGRNPCQTTA
jgi:hypothetical protein